MDHFLQFQPSVTGARIVLSQPAVTLGSVDDPQNSPPTMRAALPVQQPPRKFRLPPIMELPSQSDDAPKLRPEDLDTDFKRKYPPDAQLGSELDDGARVWKVYRDEAMEHDTRRLEGWNNTVNILLTFAGLFSAAVTAFVIDSYKLLQPDNSQQYVAAALYALVVSANQTAAATLGSPPPVSVPSSLPRWINGLWFCSLFLSLTAALLCILVKQWLDEYTTRTRSSSKNLRYWARRHVFYSQGVDEWNVPAIISVLPLLLHLALFLFFGGISALLWSLDLVIAGVLVGLSLLLLTMYALCTLLPLWYAECPFSTPLLNQARKAWLVLSIFVLHRCVAAHRILYSVFQVNRRTLPLPLQRKLTLAMRRLWRTSDSTDEEAADVSCATPGADNIDTPDHRWVASLGEIIKKSSVSTFDRLLASSTARNGNAVCLTDVMDSKALQWLIATVSDSDANAVGLQALGALQPDSALANELRSSTAILTAATFANALTRSASTVLGAWELARIMRSLLCVQENDLALTLFGLDIPDSPLAIMRASDHPDLAFLNHALFRVSYPIALSRSSHSSVRLLLRLRNITLSFLFIFLTGLYFEDLSESDWSRIFAVLRSADLSPCRVSQAGHICGAVCLLECLARCVVEGHGSLAPVERRDTAPRLITRAVTEVNPDMAVSFSELPYLVQYMASPHFLPHFYDRSALSHITDFFTSPARWTCQDTELLATAAQALPGLLYALARDDCLLIRYGLIFARLIAGLMRGSDDPHYDWLQGTFPYKGLQAVLSLRAVLLPTTTGPCKIVVWHALCKMCNLSMAHTLSAYMQLAVVLASALCTVVRQGDDTEAERMVRAFFAGLPLASLAARVLASCHKAGYVALFLSLAQHCMELRPSWWREGVEMLASGEQDKILEHFIAEMERQLAAMGQCTACPIRTRALSVCSFDPAA